MLVWLAASLLALYFFSFPPIPSKPGLFKNWCIQFSSWSYSHWLCVRRSWMVFAWWGCGHGIW